MRIGAVLGANTFYAFIGVGVVWLVLAIQVSYLVLWPSAACLLTALLLRMRPGQRLTWALARASALMGMLLSAYQAYISVGWVNGSFGGVATASLGLFAVFAAVHALLLVSDATSKKTA